MKHKYNRYPGCTCAVIFIIVFSLECGAAAAKYFTDFICSVIY